MGTFKRSGRIEGFETFRFPDEPEEWGARLEVFRARNEYHLKILDITGYGPTKQEAVDDWRRKSRQYHQTLIINE